MEKQNICTELFFEIKPYNIDAAGHVNNAVYINWLEDLRIKLFKTIIPLETMIKKNIYVVVASTCIKYKAPLVLYDRPKGILKIDNYSKGIWYLSARFNLGYRVVTEAVQKCVLIDKTTNKMIRKIIHKYKNGIYKVNRY